MQHVRQLKDPRYTGANRCYPCTAVNLLIATVVSLVTGVLATAMWTLWIGVSLTVFLAGVSVVVIWLRGYLVPGTPTLTRAYFPEWLLARFDKEGIPNWANDSSSTDDFDLETALLEEGIVVENEAIDDLELSAKFLRLWRDRRDEGQGEGVEPAFATTLAVSAGDLKVRRYGSGEMLRINGRRVLTWPSNAAKEADLITAKALPEWIPHWGELDAGIRIALIAGIRVMLPECPDGRRTVLAEETVQSCCTSHEVVAVKCGEGDDRLVEEPV